MTPTELQKENAQLREQLAAAVTRGEEALNLAVETSVKYEQAVNTVTALAGAAVAQKDGAPPAPAPAPPPVPEPPPPLAPASWNEFQALSSVKKAELRAHFGDDLEARLHAEKMNSIRMGSASRGGFSGGIATIGEQLGGPHVLTAKERAAVDLAAYQVGAPKPLHVGTYDPVKVHQAALDRQVGWGGPAVSSTGKPAAPKAAPFGTPAPGKKVRHLGGFGIRE